MTNKQRAINLISKFSNQLPPEEAQYELLIAKNCAIISIDDQIDFIKNEMIQISWDYRVIFINELKQIKNEIELL